MPLDQIQIKESEPRVPGIAVQILPHELLEIVQRVNLDSTDLGMCESLRSLPSPKKEKRLVQRHIIDPLTDLFLDLMKDYQIAAKRAAVLAEKILEISNQIHDPNMKAFIHDFRNVYSIFFSALELYVEDNTKESMSFLTEADDALRCFIDQQPQSIQEVMACAKRICPLTVHFLGISDMQQIPCSLTDLVQIITNAGFNAKQVEATELVVSCMPTDDAILVQIVDNGPGFKSECIQEASNRSRAKNPLKGNGLGIIERICQKHGGEFEISNLSENKGACLKLKFPLH